MLASGASRLQVHDTYFVVAHFHYVLIGGALFPMFAGIYFWFPKMTGGWLNETSGKLAFLALFRRLQHHILHLHFLGLSGMPRRVYTYGSDMHWRRSESPGVKRRPFMTAGFIVFLGQRFPQRASWQNLPETIRGERRPGMVQRRLLRRLTTSAYLPTVNGRDPLWEDPPNQPVVVGMRDDIRETLVTHRLDADPQHKDEDPGPSIWPFFSAVTVSAAFVGSIFTPWAVPIGAPPVIATLIGWLWPRGQSPTASTNW